MSSETLLEFSRALANENRQDILFQVFSDKQPHSVSEVASRIGLAQSTTSEHLSILRRAGILSARKIDKQVFYTVDKDSVERVIAALQHWLTCC